jgi:hypothetical protein
VAPTSYYVSVSRWSAGDTTLLLDWFATIPLLLLLIASTALYLMHRRRARAAKLTDQPHPLAPGETVIIGKVDADEEKIPAITIDIEQQGRQWRYKSGWQHEWKESSRQVTVRPFYVTGDRGAIRVEPNQQVFLVDALDGVQRQGMVRHRTATLTAGEPVHILGTLVRAPDPRQGGYREAAMGWVLRPPSSGPMLISTEPFEERFVRRARVYRGLGIAMLSSLVLLHCVFYFSFNVLRLTGHEVSATVRSTDTYQKWHQPRHGSGHWDHYYRVTADWIDPERNMITLSDHCSKELYLALQGQKQEVPFVVSRLWPSIHMLGHEAAGDDGWGAIGALILLVSAVIAWVMISLSSRPWYERRRVIDRGSGELT